jgi:hypothetical protein
MQRVIISTTIRNAKANEPSGYLYILDLEKWQIVQRGSIIEPPYRAVDPNPRGGFRGGKGIAIYGEEIFLANTACVFRFNRDWDLLNVISHPSCSGIHDILLDRENHLWVTSARNDLLFKFNLDGHCLKFFNFREFSFVRDSLQLPQPTVLSKEDIINGGIDFRDPRTHILTTHNGTHLNSISQNPDGSMLVSLGMVVGRKFSTLLRIKDILSQQGLWSWVVRANHFIMKAFSLKKDFHSDLVAQPARGKSIVARLRADGTVTRRLILDNIHAPSHSLLSRPDGTAIYLNTAIGDVVHFNPDSGRICSKTHVSDKFLRGIVRIDDDLVMVGSQNDLLLFALSTKTIQKQFNLSNNPHEAVFAIHEFPDVFSLPPKSFAAHVGNLVGFNGREAIFE